MTSLGSVLKRRNITLPTKVPIVDVMVFQVIMYESESWIIKKSECRTIDALEMWCWRRCFGVPCTAITQTSQY